MKRKIMKMFAQMLLNKFDGFGISNVLRSEE